MRHDNSRFVPQTDQPDEARRWETGKEADLAALVDEDQLGGSQRCWFCDGNGPDVLRSLVTDVGSDEYVKKKGYMELVPELFDKVQKKQCELDATTR